MGVRGWAVLALAVLVVAVAVGALLLVPRTRPAAPRADQLAALAELPAEQVARGRALRAAMRLPSYGSMLLGLAVALLLGLTPAGARLVDAVARPFGDPCGPDWGRCNGYWLAAAVLGGLAVVLAGQVATLPLAAWRHSVLVRHGLSTQSWGGWAGDVLKAYAVTAVIAVLALASFFTLTRLFPQWWWAVAAAGAAGLVAVLSFVLPVLVEPVFNRFTPMEPGALRTELMAMARRAGVPVREVLVADASRRTRGVNAYVSGLGPTRRIVVYDTLLAEAPPEDTVSVVAHELGHARHRDVAAGTLLGALGAAAAVVAAYLLGGWGGLLRAAGVDSIAQPRAVALLVALAALAALVTGPLQAALSRRVEARADAHALALTGQPEAFAAMQVRLSAVNRSDPDPPGWERVLLGSHPTTVERIAAARAWRRGAEG